MLVCDQDDRAAADTLYEQLAAGEVLRRTPIAQLDAPTHDPALLPFRLLGPEAFERLSAEIVYRVVDGSVQFYGRRGQKQFGLDVVAHPARGPRSVYQVRRYQQMSAAQFRSAVTQFAGPPGAQGQQRAARQFDPARFVVMTSASTEDEKTLVEALADLRDAYAGDLDIDLWGAEALGRRLRDAPHLVAAAMGSAWATAWCGSYEPVPQHDPAGLGLVEDPIEIMQLDPLRNDAHAAEQAGEHEKAAALRRSLAQALDDNGFFAAARSQRSRQARLLQDSGRPDAAAAVLTTVAVADALNGEEYRWTVEKHLLDELKAQLSPAMRAKVELLDLITRWYEGGPNVAEALTRLETLRAANDTHTSALCCQVMELCLLDGLFDYDPPSALLLGPDVDVGAQLTALRDFARSLDPAERHVRARLRCAVADCQLTVAASHDDVNAAYQQLVNEAAAGRFLADDGLVLSRAAYAYSLRGDQSRAVNLWRHAVLRNTEARRYGDVRSHLRSIERAPLEEGRWDRPGPPTAGALPNDEHALGSPADTNLSAVLALQRGKLVDAFADVRKQMWHARISGHLIEEKIALRLFADLQRDAGNAATAVALLVLAGEGKLAADLAADCMDLVPCASMLQSGLLFRRAAAASVIGAQTQLYNAPELDAVIQALLEAAQTLWDAPGQFDPIPELEAIRALSKFGRRLPASAVDPILTIADPYLTSGQHVNGRDLVPLLGNLYRAVPGRREQLAASLLTVMNHDDPPEQIWQVLAAIYPEAHTDLRDALDARARGGSMEAFLILVQHGAIPESMQHVVRAGAAAVLHRPLRSDRLEPMIVQANYGTTVAACLVALINGDNVVNVAAENFTVERCQLLGRTGFATGPIPSEHADPTPRAPDPLSAEVVTLAAGDPRALAAAVCRKLVQMAEDADDLAINRIDSVRGAAWLSEYLDDAAATDIGQRLLRLHTEPRFADHDLDEINTPVLSRFQIRTNAHLLPAHALAAAAAAVRSDVQDGDIEASEDRSTLGLQATAAPDAARSVIVRATRLLRESDDQVNRLGGIALQRIAKARPELVPEFATALVAHPDEQVRAIGVEVVDRCWLDVLQILASDEAGRVRLAVAQRIIDLPDDVRRRLAADPDAQVRQAATNALQTNGAAARIGDI